MMQEASPFLPRRAERGMSLIEVAIASMVFTVGALGLVRLLYSSAEGVTVASKVTFATALARGKLDELVPLPYDHADLSVAGSPHQDGDKNLGPTGEPKKPDGSDTGTFGSNDGWFARSWTVTEADANSDGTADLKIIRVDARWYDAMNKQDRTVSLAAARSMQ